MNSITKTADEILQGKEAMIESLRDSYSKTEEDLKFFDVSWEALRLANQNILNRWAIKRDTWDIIRLVSANLA